MMRCLGLWEETNRNAEIDDEIRADQSITDVLALLRLLEVVQDPFDQQRLTHGESYHDQPGWNSSQEIPFKCMNERPDQPVLRLGCWQNNQ